MEDVITFYRTELMFVNPHMFLDELLIQFKNEGHHMAIVQRTQVGKSPETVGLVTLEDVIEEIIQAEIMDETDQSGK